MENHLDAVLPGYEQQYGAYADSFGGMAGLHSRMDDLPLGEQVYKQAAGLDA